MSFSLLSPGRVSEAATSVVKIQRSMTRVPRSRTLGCACRSLSLFGLLPVQ
jgi:hypothetical protein